MGKLITGNALEVLAGMDAESVHCCISSPPYWGLRDYGCPEVVFGGDDGCEHKWGPKRVVKRGHPGDKSTLVGTQTAELSKSAGNQGQFCRLCSAWRGQFGLEPTPEMYVEHTLEFLRAIWRVLRKDGTCWLNLGDSYASGTGRSYPRDYMDGGAVTAEEIMHDTPRFNLSDCNLKPKDLVMIPFRVALAAQADGWYLRSVIIWHKPNPMPESVRDRPTTSHEYVLLMAKSKKYYYDADAIREPTVEPWGNKQNGVAPSTKDHHLSSQSAIREDKGRMGNNPAGRNKRTVWTISTKPYKGPHYATFPPDLIEPMILAGTSPKVCAECGGPWERVVETSRQLEEGRRVIGLGPKTGGDGMTTHGQGATSLHHTVENKTIGWRPTCSCNAGTKPATVADIFCGTATVAQKCIEHGRDYLMIDIDPKSIEMAEERIAQVQIRLPLMTADHDL